MSLPILGLSNDDTEEAMLMEAIMRKIVLPIGGDIQDVKGKMAFDRLMSEGWIKLWDIGMTTVPQMPAPMPARIFVVTPEGNKRLKEIQERKRLDAARRKLQS